MKRAFVTFATPNYFPLLEVAVRSVGQFSKYPIVVYGINSDVQFSEDYDHVILRRIDVEYSGGQIFYQKFNILIHALRDEGFDELIYVESDDIVNYNIDELFDRCERIDKFPLSPVHPDNVMNQGNLMTQLGVSQRTQPYVHAHMIVNRSCLPFLEECYNISKSLTVHAPNWDESLLNVMLWKYGLTDYYTDIYDPYFESYKTYIGEGDVLSVHGYENKKISFHMIHGCKDASYALTILEKITQFNKNKNLITTL
jgi:hypothetical protein